jgi:hypothetical protein
MLWLLGGTRRRSKCRCGHCPHFQLQIASDGRLTRPDSPFFRGSLVFARPGMQFESHLGHVFSLFRGLWAAECVQISFCGPLWGPIFVGGGWSGGSFSWPGQRCCCLLLHGRECFELHDLGPDPHGYPCWQPELLSNCRCPRWCSRASGRTGRTDQVW